MSYCTACRASYCHHIATIEAWHCPACARHNRLRRVLRGITERFKRRMNRGTDAQSNSSKEFERQLLAILGANNVQVPMTGNTITAILAAHHKATQELVRTELKFAADELWSLESTHPDSQLIKEARQRILARMPEDADASSSVSKLEGKDNE